MKKEKFKIIITFIIGVVLGSSIAVYAAYTYSSKDVGYTKPGETQEISVEAALNDLYGKIPTKTLLWTNSNTSNDMDSGNIELNDEITKFTHILVQWYISTTDNTMYEDLFKVQPSRNFGGRALYGMSCNSTAGANTVSRALWYVDNTHLGYNQAWYWGATGNIKNAIIPYKIYGLNLIY